MGEQLADKPEKLNERYTLWEKIASGGMADVYRATEYGAKGSSKTVALKKILTSFSSNPEYRKMFIDEGIIGSQLTHANICQVNPLIEIDENLYIPMEFIEGKNLRQVINKVKKKYGPKPLPVPFAIYVINEVFKGLDYAHTKLDENSGKPLNIVHRDMSPQNIMLSYQGGIKLIDFGIAKAKILTNETRAGVIKGKYSYMSPEQALGSPLGPQSDIFSTGIVLWELLTGERLFQLDNDMATLKAIQDCDLKNIEPIKKNPDVTVELNRIVMRILTKDLSLRFKSAELAQQSLQKYMSEKYGSYSSRDIRKFMGVIFVEDIAAEKKKAAELYGTTVTNSQKKSSSENRELRLVEDVFEKDGTKTDVSQTSGVTSTDISNVEQTNFGQTEMSSAEAVGNDPTVMESSEKTAVSKEQENFRVPSIFGEDKNPRLMTENSITHAGVPVDSKVPLETEPLKNDSSSNSDKIELVDKVTVESTNNENSWDSVGVLSPDTKSSGTAAKIPSERSNQVQLENTGSQNRVFTQRPTDNEAEFYGQEQPKQRWAVFLAIVAVFGTIAIYQMVFSGSSRVLFDPFNQRDLTTNTVKPNLNKEAQVEETRSNLDGYNCKIRIDTDPPGASIIGENFNGNSSTGLIQAPCNEVVVLRLEKQGYEPYKISVDTSKKNTQSLPLISLQVQKIGSVVLVLDNNASVFVDGKPYGDIKANVQVEFRLPPGVHKFVFKNTLLGLIAERQFQVLDKERLVESQTIRLIDMAPAQPK